MMIKPSVEELTNENKCNRYTLVIASAKSARYVTAKQKLIKDAERSELADSSYLQGSDKQPLRRDLFEEKPVSAGIELIHDGDFHIVNPTVGTVAEEDK